MSDDLSDELRFEAQYDHDGDYTRDVRWRAADEIDRLRAEVERLKNERSIREMHVHRWIPNEQIDKAWKYAGLQPHQLTKVAAFRALALLGIVECPECGGLGMFNDGKFVHPHDPCPRCDGHGWIREERFDE